MRRSAGFSLVEVLVSVVILSFALLGTAGLTAASLKSTNTSYYRSQATVLADDILDRMRANVVKARNGRYDAAPECAGDEETMERFDCEEWSATVQDTLPGGQGKVDVVNGVATIEIQWDNGDQSFKTVSQL